MTGASGGRGDVGMALKSPSPGLAPEQVLAGVLRALANNDRPNPDHGVRVLHAFASDRMRAAIGDLDAFRRALHNALYGPLLDSEEVAAGALERRGDSARGTVTTTGRDGTVRFTVALSRDRHGDRGGCWLVSGIAREGIDL